MIRATAFAFALVFAVWPQHAQGLQLLKASVQHRQTALENVESAYVLKFAVYTLSFDSPVQQKIAPEQTALPDCSNTTNSDCGGNSSVSNPANQSETLRRRESEAMTGLGGPGLVSNDISFGIALSCMAAQNISEISSYFDMVRSTPWDSIYQMLMSLLPGSFGPVQGNTTMGGDNNYPSTNISFVQLVQCQTGISVDGTLGPCSPAITNTTLPDPWACFRGAADLGTFSVGPAVAGGIRLAAVDGSTISPTSLPLVPATTPVCTLDGLASAEDALKNLVGAARDAMSDQANLLAVGSYSLTDGFAACDALSSNVGASATMGVYIPGLRTCTLNPSDSAWATNACCNPVGNPGTCCPPSDAMVNWTFTGYNATLLAATISFNADYTDKVRVVSEGTGDMMRAQWDSQTGCLATRRAQALKQPGSSDPAMTDCAESILAGKSKAGWMNCKGDEDCYSGACVGDSCTAPVDFQAALVRCMADKLDPAVLGYLQQTLDLSPGCSVDMLVGSVKDLLASSCTANSTDDICGGGNLTTCNDRMSTNCTGNFCGICSSDGQCTSLIKLGSCTPAGSNVSADECVARGGNSSSNGACYFDNAISSQDACLAGGDTSAPRFSLCRDNGDLCSAFDFCIATSVADAAACANMSGVWISVADLGSNASNVSLALPAAAPLTGLPAVVAGMYKVGPGLCLMGVASSWYSAAGWGVLAAPAPSSAGSCGAGATLIDARVYSVPFNNELDCSVAAFVLASNTTSSGSCSAPCPRCLNASDAGACSADNITSAEACSADQGIWTGAACYKPAWKLVSSTVLCPWGYSPSSCGLLDADTCKAAAGACAWDPRAACDSRAACEQSGSCEGMQAYVGSSGPVCRVPWSTLGFNISRCTAALAPWVEAYMVESTADPNGCLLRGLDNASCYAAGGLTAWSTPRSQSECEDPKECFFMSDWPSGIAGEQCQTLCDRAWFDWRPRFSWMPGVWSDVVAATALPTWTERKLLPFKGVAVDVINGLLQTAVNRLRVDAYLAAELCWADPAMAAMRVGACSVTGADAAMCASVRTRPVAGMLVRARVPPGGGGLKLRTVFGWISVPTDQLAAGAEVQVGVVPSSNFARAPLASAPGLRTWRGCDALESLRGVGDKPVGQVVGPGLVVKVYVNGSASAISGSAWVCMWPDVTVAVCLDRYPVADFATADDAGVLTPLLVAVSTDPFTQDMCGVVNLAAAAAAADGSVTLVPIRRTASLTPNVAISAAAATVVVRVGLASRTLWTEARSMSLREATGMVVGLEAGNVTIPSESICDALPCATYDAGRGGVSILQQVAPWGAVSTPAILAAINDARFAAGLSGRFQDRLASRGLPPLDLTVLSVTLQPPATPPPATPPPPPPPPPSTSQPNPFACPDDGLPCVLPVTLFESPEFSISDPEAPFVYSSASFVFSMPGGAWPLGETRPLKIRVLNVTGTRYGNALGSIVGATLAGPVAYFEPSGIVFRRPVPVLLRLPAGAGGWYPGRVLVVFRFNETSGAWEQRAPCSSPPAGADANSVCGETLSFSAYGPLAVPPAAAGGGGGGRACDDGCIAGSVIGSVFGAGILASLVWFIVFRSTDGGKGQPLTSFNSDPVGNTREEARGAPEEPPRPSAAPSALPPQAHQYAALPAAAGGAGAGGGEPRVVADGDHSEWDV